MIPATAQTYRFMLAATALSIALGGVVVVAPSLLLPVGIVATLCLSFVFTPVTLVVVAVAISGVDLSITFGAPQSVAGFELGNLAVAYVVLCAAIATILERELQEHTIRAFILGALAVVAMAALAGVENLHGTMRLLGFAAVPLLAYFVVAQSRIQIEGEEIHRVITRIFSAMVTLAVIATIVAGVRSGSLFFSSPGEGTQRLVGGLGASSLAFFTIPPLLYFLSVYVTSGHRGSAWVSLALGFVLLATQTRGAILGAAAAIVIIYLIAQRPGRLLVTVLGLVCVFVVVLTVVPHAASRLMPGTLSANSPAYGNIGGRERLWSYIWHVYVEPHPVTGSGLGATEELFAHPLARFETIGAVHNDYLWIAAETGVVGFLLYVGTILAVIRRLAKVRPRDNIHQAVKLSAIGSVVAILVVSAGDNVLANFAHFTVPVAALCGLAVAREYQGKKDQFEGGR